MLKPSSCGLLSLSGLAAGGREGGRQGAEGRGRASPEGRRSARLSSSERVGQSVRSAAEAIDCVLGERGDARAAELMKLAVNQGDRKSPPRGSIPSSEWH